MQTLEDILDFQSLDVRVCVPVIRTVNGGRVTNSQLKTYNNFPDVNQNYICSMLVVNNTKNGLYSSLKLRGLFDQSRQFGTFGVINARLSLM
jgi:hypothetical protein